MLLLVPLLDSPLELQSCLAGKDNLHKTADSEIASNAVLFFSFFTLKVRQGNQIWKEYIKNHSTTENTLYRFYRWLFICWDSGVKYGLMQTALSMMGHRHTFIFINTDVRQIVPPFYKNHMETIFWGVMQFTSSHQQQMGIEPCKKEEH